MVPSKLTMAAAAATTTTITTTRISASPLSSLYFYSITITAMDGEGDGRMGTTGDLPWTVGVASSGSASTSQRLRMAWSCWSYAMPTSHCGKDTGHSVKGVLEGTLSLLTFLISTTVCGILDLGNKSGRVTLSSLDS